MPRLSYLCLAALLALSQADERLASQDAMAAVGASGRIINGSPAPIERYPYTVQVFRTGWFTCGGFLITRGHVLSAAHCIFDKPSGHRFEAEDFFIRAQTSFTTDDSLAQTRHVDKYILHEDFDQDTYDSDVVLMVLNSTMSLNQRVQVAQLSPPDFSVDYYQIVTAVGWGRTTTTIQSKVLKQVFLMKVNHTECDEAHRRRAERYNVTVSVNANMFCAGWPGSGGMDSCSGDSGGPVIYTRISQETGEPEDTWVVGITSWGVGECASPDYMGVNVRISAFYDWIWDKVKQNSDVPGLEDESNTAEDGNNGTGSNATSATVLLASLLALSVFRRY